jgi:HD-like signal output (HDOD) protein
MESLPSLPALYVTLLEKMQQPETTIKELGEIISQDPGMTAKTLQLVNSAFFGLSREITNPMQAVSLLGMNTVQALLLSSHTFSQFDTARCLGFSFDALWRHSIRVGACAKRIVQAEGLDRKVMEDAYTAGLLHDAGILVLASSLPEQYAKVLELAHVHSLPLDKAERELLSISHAEVGAYLMTLWGLPSSIVEIIAYHHHPAECRLKEISALTAVHIANVLEHDLYPEDAMGSLPIMDRDYLNMLHLEERLPEWRMACEQACPKG